MSDYEESPASLIGVLAAVVIAAAIGAVLVLQPEPTSATRAPAVELTGIVKSSGPITLSKTMGGTRELAMVELPNGSVVSALVAAGGPLSPGDHVVLSTLTAPTTGLVVGLSQYEVVAKQ